MPTASSSNTCHRGAMQGGRHIATGVSADSPAPAHTAHVQRLLSGVQHERKNGCINFQGQTQAFDQFLVRQACTAGKLAAAALPWPPGAAPDRPLVSRCPAGWGGAPPAAAGCAEAAGGSVPAHGALAEGEISSQHGASAGRAAAAQRRAGPQGGRAPWSAGFGCTFSGQACRGSVQRKPQQARSCNGQSAVGAAQPSAAACGAGQRQHGSAMGAAAGSAVPALHAAARGATPACPAAGKRQANGSLWDVAVC